MDVPAVPRRTFPSTPESMGDVRRFVEKHAADHARVDDAVLVADELATNAYQHTGAPEFAVSLFIAGEGVMVMVWTTPLTVTTPHVCSDGFHGRSGGERGRGLFLVDALAEDWDAVTVNGSQVVYAVLQAPREGAALAAEPACFVL